MTHCRSQEDGSTVSWIDENLNPFTGDWISRTRLKAFDGTAWPENKGGKERGKDYNHSTFNDLVISGLIGVRPEDSDKLMVNPLVPDNSWEYFCLDNLCYRGKTLTVCYDRTGKRYNKGAGFAVFIDGKEVFRSAGPERIKITL